MRASDGQYRDSSRLAVRADFVRRHGTGDWFGWLAARTPLAAGAKVLDVGCGPGWFWGRTIAGRPPIALTLTDRSPGMVAEAQARMAPLAPVRCLAADAMALPFPDGSFDAVFAMHMLYHVPDAGGALAEIARVLRPGGTLYATTLGDGDLEPVAALSRRVFGRAGTDTVIAAFGSSVAGPLIAAEFGAVRHDRMEDLYHLDQPDEIVALLGSYPPGSQATPAETEALRAAAEAAIAEAGGRLDAPRFSDLFTAIKA